MKKILQDSFSTITLLLPRTNVFTGHDIKLICVLCCLFLSMGLKMLQVHRFKKFKHILFVTKPYIQPNLLMISAMIRHICQAARLQWWWLV